MHFNTNESRQGDISEKNVNKYKLYNLLFSGRISLQEYHKALRMLDGKKEN